MKKILYILYFFNFLSRHVHQQKIEVITFYSNMTWTINATVLLRAHILWYTPFILTIIDSCIVDVVINRPLSGTACALYLMHATIFIKILIERHRRRLHMNWIKHNDREGCYEGYLDQLLSVRGTFLECCECRLTFSPI